MVEGEAARLHIPAAAGYGAEGLRAPPAAATSASEEWSVPPHADLCYDVTLLAVTPAATSAAGAAAAVDRKGIPDSYDPLPDAVKLKEQGNARLAAHDPGGARYKYKHALQFLDLPPHGRRCGSRSTPTSPRRAWTWNSTTRQRRRRRSCWRRSRRTRRRSTAARRRWRS
jgi:hypothetical protein